MAEFKEFSILTPTPMLGYGYPLAHFWHGITTYKPTAIIVDSGSTDPGPYLMGTGLKLCSKSSYIRDLTPILEASSKYGIKVLISSAGGDGTNAHVEELFEIIREIATDKRYNFKIATIYAEIPSTTVMKNFKLGKIHPCSSAPELTSENIQDSKVIVAQMGMEPFLQVLQSNPEVDIILSGRSYDPAPFAGWCIYNGVEPSSAWHMGKIMECGGLCALPKGSAMIATMRKDSFDLIPLNPIERCTPLSVAAHTLYEKTRPDRLPGPGGILYLDKATYTQLPDGRSVRVKGSVFHPSETYQVKLEGVSFIGYRTVFIGGIRDPILIAGIDAFLSTVRSKTQEAFPIMNSNPNIHLIFHIYGRNAVMGQLEPTPLSAHEIGVLGEVSAPTQEMASSIAGFARTMCLHCSYEGQIATAGNFASPLTPLEQPAGPVYKFSLYHVMDVEDPTSLFPHKIMDIRHQMNRANGTNGVNGVNGTTSYPPLERVVLPPLVTKPVPSGPASIRDLAKIVRSKNSGPFELTLDILFDDATTYHRVRQSDVLNKTAVKKLYKVEDDGTCPKSANDLLFGRSVTDLDIVTLMYLEPALAWKCTLKRPWEQGTVGERDTFGTQQYAPLLSIVVPGIN